MAKSGTAPPVVAAASASGSNMTVKRELVKLEDEEDRGQVVQKHEVQILNRAPTPPPLVQILLPSYPSGVYCSMLKVRVISGVNSKYLIECMILCFLPFFQGPKEVILYVTTGLVLLVIITTSATLIWIMRRLTHLRRQVTALLTFPSAEGGPAVIEMKTLSRTSDPDPPLFSI